MDTGILLVAIVLSGTIILFVSDRIRIDLVAILATLSLAWLGVITPKDAISGFASNAVVAIASVMILGYGIERTGVTSRLASTLVRYAGTSEKRVTTAVSATVGLLSSFMNNVGAACPFSPRNAKDCKTDAYSCLKAHDANGICSNSWRDRDDDRVGSLDPAERSPSPVKCGTVLALCCHTCWSFAPLRGDRIIRSCRRSHSPKKNRRGFGSHCCRYLGYRLYDQGMQHSLFIPSGGKDP